MIARISTAGTLLACFAAFFANALTANADNSYYTIAFETLENSSDPSSDVVFKTVLELSEADRDGNDVGWEVIGAYFIQPVSGGSDKAWKTDAVTVPTSDGLWWVEHGKPNEPQAAEFDMPPLLAGEASAWLQTTQPLVYSVEGKGGYHGENMLRFSYSYRLKYEEEPEEEEDDDEGGIDEDPWIPPISVMSREVADTTSHLTDSQTIDQGLLAMIAALDSLASESTAMHPSAIAPAQVASLMQLKVESTSRPDSTSAAVDQRTSETCANRTQ
jgi:hypothetical protein